MTDRVISEERPHGGSQTILGRIDRLAAGLSFVLMVAGSILLAVVTLWILASVLSRGIEAFSVTGTAEVAANSVVAISLLCAPYVMRRGGHIRTGIVVDRLSARGQRVASRAAYLIGAVVFAFLAWAAWDPMINSWLTGEYTGEGSLRVPSGPLRTIVVVSALMMAIECLLTALKQAPSVERENSRASKRTASNPQIPVGRKSN